MRLDFFLRGTSCCGQGGETAVIRIGGAAFRPLRGWRLWITHPLNRVNRTGRWLLMGALGGGYRVCGEMNQRWRRSTRSPQDAPDGGDQVPSIAALWQYGEEGSLPVLGRAATMTKRAAPMG